MNQKGKDKLLESPMFQLSLSSKELFHSNFLYWISKISKEMFKHVIAQLFENAGQPIVLGEWPKEFEVMREHNHYDLCVVDDKNAKSIWLVIENKVKSIPDKIQLEDYTKNPELAENTKFMLLSLSTHFPFEKEIKEGNWAVANYLMLSEILNNCLDSNLFTLTAYQSALISDYAEMIGCLHKIQEEWKDISEFITPEAKRKRLGDLRLNDLQEKNRFSNMYARVRQKIETELKVTIKGSSRKEIFGDRTQQTNYNPGDRNVFLGWGMTRSQGLLEAKILVKENVLLLVQIQGNQYRHCVELYKSGSSAKDNWEKYSNDSSTAWFISTLNGNKPFGHFAGSPVTLEIRPDTTRKKQYNQYGDEFLYKSITIPETTTVDEVIKMLISDCENILKHVDLGSSLS